MATSLSGLNPVAARKMCTNQALSAAPPSTRPTSASVGPSVRRVRARGLGRFAIIVRTRIKLEPLTAEAVAPRQATGDFCGFS